MKTTHTHKGLCQVCGLVHAVDNKSNVLAKHGYDVSWGFFNGICSGADNLPIQLDRALADKTINSLDKEIARLQTSLSTINDWFPKTVYGYKLDGKFVRLPSIYGTFHSADRLQEKATSKSSWSKRDYEYLIEKGYSSVALTYDEFVTATDTIDYEDPDRYLKNWRETRERALKSDIDQAEGHKHFLQELIEKYHGKPLFESAMIIKVVKELTAEASQEILNEKPIILYKTAWDGREYKKRVYSIWDSEATKEINGHTLTIKCKRNTKNYNGYLAYTYLDGKKVSRKKLEEVLG